MRTREEIEQLIADVRRRNDGLYAYALALHTLLSWHAHELPAALLDELAALPPVEFFERRPGERLQ